MDKIETKRVLDLLDANYDILTSKTDDQIKILVFSWFEILRYYDFSNVISACKNYMTNNRIKPKPSDIKTELDVMQAKRHFVHKQIENIQKEECEAKLTKQNLQNLFNREFAPFTQMNLSPQLREKLISKHDQEYINEFVTKVWGFVMGSDFQVFHIEMALGELRGAKFTFEKFMKSLVNSREFADNFNENKEDNVNKCKKYLNQLVNKKVA